MSDELFLPRVYRSSFWWSLLVVAVLLISRLTSVAAGFALGVALGMGTLRAIEYMTGALLRPDAKQGRKVRAAFLAITKYFILSLILYLIVRAPGISLPAFACGVGVPTAIIFLKALGRFFQEMRDPPGELRSPPGDSNSR